jgi:hypothetical protein
MYIASSPTAAPRQPSCCARRTAKAARSRNETLANLSSLSIEQAHAMRRVLRGEKVVGVDDLFEAIRSPHHGHVHAVRVAMRRLGIAELISSRPCRERDLVLAMITARVAAPDCKLATSRWWHATTIPEEFAVADPDEDDLYEALDWLGERQERIEGKLARRHLTGALLGLYDLMSVPYQGETCPLAARGPSGRTSRV